MSDDYPFLNGGGELAERMRAFDWSATPLGPMTAWPQSLKTTVAILLRSTVPLVLLWGEDGVMIYNDAYAVFAGGRHPTLLGSKVREGWPEVADFNDRVMRVGLAGGTLSFKDQELTLCRSGEAEQVWMDLEYSPVLDERGEPAGVLAVVFETSDKVRAERAAAREQARAAEAQAAIVDSESRLRFLDRLAAATAAVNSADEVLAITTRLLGEHLALSVAAYADMDEDQDGFTIRGDWAAPGSATIVGRYSLAAFGRHAVEKLNAGEPLVIENNLVELAPEAAAAFQAIGITATICMPLIKAGRLTALMAVHDRRPRRWTPAELALVREVTARSWAHVERVGAMAALIDSEARFRQLADAMPQLVWAARPDGTVDYYNARQTSFRGLEHLGDSYDWAPIMHPDDLAKTEAAWMAAMREGVSYTCEHRLAAADGRWVWHVSRAEPVRDEAGRIIRWYGTATDIHALKTVEQRLAELNARLEAQVASVEAERRVFADVVEGTDAFIQVVDQDYRWLAINKASADEFERIYGVRPAVGLSMLDLLADRPEDQAALRAVWSRALGGEVFTEVAELGALDRRAYEMKYDVLRDDGGRQIGAYQFVYDVTERLSDLSRLMQAEEALRQSQKMEAVGQLTGGVAHDFNNLLTPIVGALDFLANRSTADDRAQRLTKGALQAAERAKVLVQRLLAFSRRQHLKTEVVELGEMIEGMEDLLRRSLGPGVVIDTRIETEVPAALVDRNQLELALLNLAVNARDAMNAEGRLTLSLASGRRPGAPVSEAPMVALSVTDTGAGMDAETLARAIDPFFTTKEVGKGTGLGLSMVHGLAVQSGGALELRSEPGLGTTATLWLPTAEGASSDLEAPADPLPDVEDKPLQGRVLLVDDEDVVRAGAAELLREAGLAVVEARSARDALVALSKASDVDLIVTDYAMPGGNGADLVAAARRERPGLPAVMITGFTGEDMVRQEAVVRVAKPFTRDELVTGVRLALTKAAR